MAIEPTVSNKPTFTFNPSFPLDSAEENVIYVYAKNGDLLFIFDNNNDGESEDSLKNQMVSPIISWEQNGTSSLTFQILAQSWAFQNIKDPENLYYVNGKFYTPINENSYVYSGEGTTRIVNVTCVETWYLLNYQYHQCYNAGLYTIAKGTFTGYTQDGAQFRIYKGDCSIPGDSVSNNLCWEQVKLWRTKDSKGNDQIYSVLKSEENKPTGWDDAPANVLFKSFSVSGNYAYVTISTATKGEVTHNFDWNRNNSYTIQSKPLPTTLKRVYVNITNVAVNYDAHQSTISSYEKDVNYSYSSSTGTFSIRYTPTGGETINWVSCVYEYCNLGDIKAGATCTFGYGAEVVDEHTFLVLPKADTRYKLTIDGVQYEDSQVKDSRGAIMPRGSGGYAMWAALKNTGWSLGICDVIAKDFDTSIDYGCFNVETDQKSTLYNIQNIQELYGGLLQWDSKSKVLNYRAENYEDYQAYKDGFNDWQGYAFVEGKNMRSQPEVVIDNDIITRAYLLGYGGLNVKAVNNNKTYIENFSFTTDLYEGYLEQPLIMDTRDTSGQKQLLYWGQKELAKRCRPRRTITVDVNDIRTVEGYEHEVFHENEIVKVITLENETTNEETVEEKRVIGWEYNVFAMYESTVTLGEKTQNISEIFKLIYNMTMDAPKTDGSGNISSSDIIMDNGQSMPQYIELLARTTTSNTDAIANLVLQTSNLFSSVDLFAQYQSTVNDMFTDTYAGLSFYADQVGSNVLIEARGEYTSLVNDLRTETRAGFQAEQNARYALAQQFASFKTQTANDIQQSIATMKSYADREIATNDVIAMFTRNGITSTAALNQYVSEEISSYRLISSLESNGVFGYAGISTMVERIAEEIVSSIRLEVNESRGSKYLELTGTGLEFGSNTINIDELTPSGIITDYASSSAWGLPALHIIGYALNLESQAGDIYLNSRSAYIQIMASGEIALVGNVTINGQPYSSGGSGGTGYSTRSMSEESNGIATYSDEPDIREMLANCMSEIETLKREIEELKNNKMVED